MKSKYRFNQLSDKKEIRGGWLPKGNATYEVFYDENYDRFIRGYEKYAYISNIKKHDKWVNDFCIKNDIWFNEDGHISDDTYNRIWKNNKEV